MADFALTLDVLDTGGLGSEPYHAPTARAEPAVGLLVYHVFGPALLSQRGVTAR